MSNQQLFDQFSESDLACLREKWGELASERLGAIDEVIRSDEMQALLQQQYLAHWVLALQDKVAKKVNNPIFKISLIPMKNIKAASSEYLPRKFFNVYYPIELDNKELYQKNVRELIAHELGHLFVQVLFDQLDTCYSTKDVTEVKERVSTLAAMSILRDKSKFYRSVGSQEHLKYTSPEHIIRGCLQIHNLQSSLPSHSS